MVQVKKRKDISSYTFWVALGLILIGIIYFKPPVFLFIPLLISTVVMLLQSRVSRYAFLIGGLNCLLYTVAYVMQTLYAMAAFSLFISLPLQMVAFFNWRNNTHNNQTTLKQMTPKTRVIVTCSVALGWCVLYLLFSAFGSKYLLMDNTASVLGALCNLLCTLRYREYAIFQTVTYAIIFTTYILMLGENPMMIIWAISSANALLCTVLAWFRMKNRTV